jgi:ribosome modulation factor
VKKTKCGHCHECGCPLVRVLDGEEWCGVCDEYKRYKSHGWGSSGEGDVECPEQALVMHASWVGAWIERNQDD